MADWSVFVNVTILEVKRQIASGKICPFGIATDNVIRMNKTGNRLGTQFLPGIAQQLFPGRIDELEIDDISGGKDFENWSLDGLSKVDDEK